MKTNIYIDGFNLYYGAVKDTPYKWLDLKALFTRILQPYNQINTIKYFTARVAARANDTGAPSRQDVYLRALEAHIPEIEINYGHFLQSTVRMRLANPMSTAKSGPPNLVQYNNLLASKQQPGYAALIRHSEK